MNKLLEYPKVDVCGIYGIQCLVSNKWYVGQTEKFNKRFKEHTSTLSKNKHVNDHLQRAFNLYGSDAFVVHILKECEEEKLDFWEKYFMDYYQAHIPDCGYNIMYFDEHGKPKYNEYFAEKVIKGSRHKHKITFNDARVIRDMYVSGFTPAVIIDKYKLNDGHVSEILSNTVWYDPSYTRPKQVPSLNPVESKEVNRLMLQGKSISGIIKDTGINWGRLKRYIRDNKLSRSPKHSSLVLNLETGIYYNSISEAANSCDIPYSRLSTWLKKHPNRNKTSFILVGNNPNKKSINNVVILDTAAGVYYTSFKEAAPLHNISARTITKWLTTHKHHNKTNLILCDN